METKNTHDINIFGWTDAEQAWEIMQRFEDRVRELESVLRTIIELGGTFALPTIEEIKRFCGEKLPPEPKRPCVVCGKEQAHKKVCAKYRKQVICLSCGQAHTFDADGNVIRRASNASAASEIMTAIHEAPAAEITARKASWVEALKQEVGG